MSQTPTLRNVPEPIDRVSLVEQLSALRTRLGAEMTGCTVVRREMHGLDWRATCQGRTRLGETIEVVVKVIDAEAIAPGLGAETESKVVVITVYKRTSR
jgi:hypothetical protein